MPVSSTALPELPNQDIRHCPEGAAKQDRAQSRLQTPLQPPVAPTHFASFHLGGKCSIFLDRPKAQTWNNSAALHGAQI